MKTSFSSSNRGSAFITVVGFCVVLLLLIGSVLQYSTSERRNNNRAKLLLEARTAAEGISEYGIAQVKNILDTNRTFTDSTWASDGTGEGLFTPGGTYQTSIGMPPDAFWGGGHIADGTVPGYEPLMRVGKILAGAGLYYVDPLNPDNENDPLKGKRLFRYDMDILSRASAKDSFTNTYVTKYMKQSFAIRAVPLFSNAVYYNMDMEVQPGPNMTITGSTHVNGRIFARSASASPGYINFAGPVTAVKGFWTNFTSAAGDNLMPYFQSINATGGLQTNATTGLVQILVAGTTTFKGMCLTANTSGFTPNLSNGTWVESTWNLHPSGETWQQHLGDASPPTETVTSMANFANWIQQTFQGNLLTNVNGLTPNKIQGIPDYTYVYGSVYPDPLTGTLDAAYTYNAGGNDINNSAHAMIETPRLPGVGSFNQATEDIKYSHRVGLYISANTTGATKTGHKPDGTTIQVAAHSYRAFKTDGTEVILPGQNTYGDANVSTNPYASHKNARPIVQMYNIDYDGTGPGLNQEKILPTPSYRRMTDMRRTAGGNTTTPALDSTTTFYQGTARSTTNVYVAKNLWMIDIDMMELKKAVRTIGVATGTNATSNTDYYDTGIPTAGNYNNFIYNPVATPKSVPLSNDTRIITTDATTLTNAYNANDWNGGVYIESIAADQFDTTPGFAAPDVALRKAKTHELHDSGVRIINGRGKVPSLNDADTTGFTLATNDAVYVLGTFNADGLSSTPSPVARLVPTTPGESTGHFPETGELPASIIADAVYLLSQPNNDTNSSQNAGWNDVYSGCPYKSGSWVSGWASTPPSSTNALDGDPLGAASYPYKVPYDSASGKWSTGTSSTVKLGASFTEYATALLMGLVPTGKNGINQTSGGLHNFPRFLEDWGSVECRIRGSFVALFECRIAEDPWNLRVYAPPNRVWGFNLLFDSGVMPPLTPKTVQIRRVGANDITKADWNAKMTAWGYPSLP